MRPGVSEFFWQHRLDARQRMLFARGDFEVRTGSTLWHLYDGAFYIGGFVRVENAQRFADGITAQLDAFEEAHG